MPCRRLAAALAALALPLGACAPKERASMNHPILLDEGGGLLAWTQPQADAYDDVARRATGWLLDASPMAPNGEPAYYSYSTLSADGRRPVVWPHNPAGLYAMMVEYALAWYAYSGDPRLPEVVTGLLDHTLARGTTPAGWAWAGVPWSSGEPGSLDYAGAGPGDAPGVLEPDKVGELGHGYLRWHLFTGEPRFLDAAIACADALADHVAPGSDTASPWPFRVSARDGAVVEAYSSSVVGALRLFDGLQRLGAGRVADYAAARATAWAWLLEHPIGRGHWSGYFEDIPVQASADNFNQISPLETARWLLERPEVDPAWATHVPAILELVEARLSRNEVPDQPGTQWGAVVLSEQLADQDRMGSHTARFASVSALWAARGGSAEAREKAFRSFNWATYMCREDGVVNTGPLDAHVWFTDGYADYVRHFLAGMAAWPAWAPPGADHLLGSSAVVRQVAYAPGLVTYAAAEDGDEVLRLTFAPQVVEADGAAVDPAAVPPATSFTWDGAAGVLRVHRAGARAVRVAAAP